MMTRALVSSAVPLLLATPGILLYHVHYPTCLDDSPEMVRSVLNLQLAMPQLLLGQAGDRPTTPGS